MLDYSSTHVETKKKREREVLVAAKVWTTNANSATDVSKSPLL